ncbi:MAG TPA: class I SAM-dependent methyltransferase [Streptosporangiaceae bacterium]
MGDAANVLNVGAGTGSYEPDWLRVAAIEPAGVMLAQRPATAAPAVMAVAEALPFGNQSFDAAMALLTVHHWTDPARGLAELRRVASRVILLCSTTLTNGLWLTRDYFPAMARQRRPEIQAEAIAGQFGELGWRVRIETIPLPRDCLDGFGEAFWARPAAYLDAKVRAGMSAFALLTDAERRPGLERLAVDLASGTWQARNGDLADMAELDCGHRLLVADREAEGAC